MEKLKKSPILLLAVFILFSACTPREPGIQDQNTPIDASLIQPSETPSSVNPNQDQQIQLATLSSEDLAPIAILAGDLPDGYHSSHILPELPNLFSEIPKPAIFYYQLIEEESKSAGGVAILVYNDKASAQITYEILHTGMGIDETISQPGIGERAEIYVLYQMGSAFRFVDLLFMRCTTVVHIRLGETHKQDEAISYAQRLDARLTPVVCAGQ